MELVINNRFPHFQGMFFFDNNNSFVINANYKWNGYNAREIILFIKKMLPSEYISDEEIYNQLIRPRIKFIN